MGQIAIPKPVRDRLNLSGGKKLTLRVRGHNMDVSKERAWRKLESRGRLRLDGSLLNLQKAGALA